MTWQWWHLLGPSRGFFFIVQRAGTTPRAWFVGVVCPILRGVQMTTGVIWAQVCFYSFIYMRLTKKNYSFLDTITILKTTSPHQQMTCAGCGEGTIPRPSTSNAIPMTNGGNGRRTRRSWGYGNLLGWCSRHIVDASRDMLFFFYFSSFSMRFSTSTSTIVNYHIFTFKKLYSITCFLACKGSWEGHNTFSHYTRIRRFIWRHMDM